MRYLSKNISIFGIGILLSAGIFCAISGVSFAGHSNMGEMPGLCVSEDGSTVLCALNGLGHASFLETISYAMPQKIGEYMLFFAFALLLFAFGKQFAPQLHRFKAHPFLLYIKSATLFIFNPLRLAFSRGIIHPQIYNAAYIS